MRHTIKDVAREANVSISTVSYAMNNSDRISEKTRNHVLEVAKRLNYSANSNAKRLRQKNVGAIGVFFNSWFGPIYSELVQGIEQKVHEMGYDLIACSLFGGAESTAHRYLKDQMIDGAIILSNAFDDDFLESVAANNLPIVVLDREITAPNIYNILIDNFGGAFSATKQLIDSGSEKVYYMSGPTDSYDNQKRLDGYIAALGFYNLKFSNELIIRSDFTEKDAYEKALELFSKKSIPGSIFAGNDEMALGVIKAANEKKIKIPEQLKLVGFDNIRESERCLPALSTVKHDKFDMGVKSVEVLFNAMNNEDYIEPVTILPTKYVARDSI
ncbi:LacI family DNA-binding transcriptional regulator [Vibrio methylphosphonaticus]|uniref:LacI family DNA-binding transcriptional regulator n=1 Tax=Vibrio methylphosphonaticus TaxID=2946866 RepID=UPI00202A321D|nr:LacI family DNA-binding transcriptional regulator [Vibrio methylphosphonaticus]MCL9774065.1 LacI family transcriptional regulator [Vibrio methylphosphonaticus]